MAFFPLAHVRFERASRLHPAGDGKATLSTRRTKAHRRAGHLRISRAAASLSKAGSRLSPGPLRNKRDSAHFII
jgi:hypothetical protein